MSITFNIFIQARSSSKRLPFKVLRLIDGQPAIIYLVNRLKRARGVSKIVVATTSDRSDDRLCVTLEKHGVDYYRGEESDVLKRFVGCADAFPCDYIVRITGDCPLVSPELVTKCIDHIAENNYDYVSNIEPPTFPDGLDVEVFPTRLLRELESFQLTSADREHVTYYIRRNKSLYHTLNVVNNQDLSAERLTLDTVEDYDFITGLISSMDLKVTSTLEEVCSGLKIYTEGIGSNMHDVRNHGMLTGSGQKLWGTAKRLIPGGNSLLSKRAEMFLPDLWPAYFSKAKGCTVTDLDGRRYKDFSTMSVGACSLGYANKYIDNSVIRAVRDGNMTTLNAPEEVYLAERLTGMHSWADMVKYTRSGGEANAVAVRIARAATGRDRVLLCGYHGWHDWYLAANLSSDSALSGHLLPGLSPNGVPDNLQGTVSTFEYNDVIGFRNLVAEGPVAAVIMEVQRNSSPNIEFLEEIRRICTQQNIVLIFDECTSGFRETFGGLHLKYKISPDMAMFGKALGNGFAINAILGKRDVMEAAQTTFISSTFWTERIGSVAGLATLDLMEKERSWERLPQIGDIISKGWAEAAESEGVKIKVSGIRALPTFSFSNSNLIAKTYFTQEMLKKGYLASTAFYASLSHTTELCNAYLRAVRSIFRRMSRLELSEKCLDGPVSHDGFKRLN